MFFNFLGENAPGPPLEARPLATHVHFPFSIPLLIHFSRHATAFEAQHVCTASWQAQKQHIPFIHEPGMLSLVHSLAQFSLVFKICLPPQTYIMWLPLWPGHSELCVTHIEQPDWNTNIAAGFHTEGGGGGGGGRPGISPSQQQFSPPPRNLEIEYGYYCGGINISYLCYWT